jgi:AraC-like DNA-binding protein
MHRCQVIGAPWPGVHATRIESARHYGRHTHGTFGLGVMERGAHRSASGRGEVEVAAGDLLTTNPGEVHDGRPLHAATRRWRIVYLEPSALAELLDRPAAALEFDAPVYRDPRLRAALVRLLDQLERCAAPAGHVDRLACDEALAELTGRLPRWMRGAPREVTADLRAVRDRLLDELSAPPLLAELAAMAGLSRFQLVRQFKRAHGLPPHRWLLMQRAERARRQIRAGARLAQAAAAAGFADQSHMNRTFMRCFGFTPGAWRQAVVAP